jgi:hypothetical protein
LKKEYLAGKYLLFRRVNLLSKGALAFQLSLKSQLLNLCEVFDSLDLLKVTVPNKHFGTKVRTMVRFFVPLCSDHRSGRIFPQSGEFFSSLF